MKALILLAIAASAFAQDTITISLSGGSNNIRYCWGEWTNIAATPLDQVHFTSQSSASTSVTSGSTSTTTQAGELLVGTVYSNSATVTYTAGTSYSLVDTGTSGQRTEMEYQNVSSLGTYAATFTISSSETYAANIATFKNNGSTPAVVSGNHNCAVQTSSVASQAWTMGSASPSGDLIVVSTRTGSTGITGVSVSDSYGNTWTPVNSTSMPSGGTNDNNAGGYIMAWYTISNGGSAPSNNTMPPAIRLARLLGFPIPRSAR